MCVCVQGCKCGVANPEGKVQQRRQVCEVCGSVCELYTYGGGVWVVEVVGGRACAAVWGKQRGRDMYKRPNKCRTMCGVNVVPR